MLLSSIYGLTSAPVNGAGCSRGAGALAPLLAPAALLANLLLAAEALAAAAAGDAFDGEALAALLCV